MLLEQRVSSRENRCWTGVLLYPGYKEWDRGLTGHLPIGWGICWLDEAHIRSGGRVRQIPSPYGGGGEAGYTAQEDLKSINSYNTGEGRMIGVWFSHSCIPRPSLVLSVLSSLGNHSCFPPFLYRWPTFLFVCMSHKFWLKTGHFRSVFTLAWNCFTL